MELQVVSVSQVVKIGGLCEAMLKIVDADSPGRAAHLNTLANAYVVEGDEEKAGPLYEESLSLLERFLGADHPDVAVIKENMRRSRSQ